MVAICATWHEGTKILSTYKIDRHSLLGICGIQGVNYLPLSGKLLDFFIEERRDYPHCTNTAIGLNCFNKGHELSMIGVVIHPIALIVGEEALVRGDRGHDTMDLGVIGAAKALN
jgi:hypothetical protein